MELISVDRRTELINSARSLDKLELRDEYQIDATAMQAWRSQGVAAAAEVMEPGRVLTASRAAAGMRMRRVKVVAEPLSEYFRFMHAITGVFVDAGEDVRWLPRRLTSTLLLPGNDCFVLDEALVIFNVLDGDYNRAEIQLYQEPQVAASCRGAFEAAWALAIPHHEYSPA